MTSQNTWLVGFGVHPTKWFTFWLIRYTIIDIESAPSGEIIIDKDGKITISGIDPMEQK